VNKAKSEYIGHCTDSDAEAAEDVRHVVMPHGDMCWMACQRSGCAVCKVADSKQSEREGKLHMAFDDDV